MVGRVFTTVIWLVAGSSIWFGVIKPMDAAPNWAKGLFGLLVGFGIYIHMAFEDIRARLDRLKR